MPLTGLPFTAGQLRRAAIAMVRLNTELRVLALKGHGWEAEDLIPSFLYTP